VRHLLGLGLLVLLLAPSAAAAQGATTTGRATARVFTVPITFLNLQDLDFGIVTLGVPKTVIQNTASAGKIRVAGQPNAFAQIRFTLPTQLDNVQALPGITMPITFAANSARWRRRIDATGGGTIFNPAVGVNNARFGGNANPYFFVYLGGTVTPSASQAPGIYQGTIILTITYL
jgi:spore coat protein U-like protein